jgi:hypothetical protein
MVKTDMYLFVARAHEDDNDLVQIWVSNAHNGFTTFNPCILPYDAIQSSSFTVMDASEDSVFLHIQNHGPEIPLGNIFISNHLGTQFSLSTENVLRGTSYVDFEKLSSLQGVYFVNKYAGEHSHTGERLVKDANYGESEEGEDMGAS